jgi:dihydrofolate synthase/folylpolyglutamate synthase
VTPLERLFALEQFGIKLGLDNIRTLLDALDHPERAWRSIHIAGTNGKGSVAAMVERGFRAAGLRTGRYTSPHLDRIEERVAIDGVAISPEKFLDATAHVMDVADKLRASGALTVSPTFFEVSTAIAFEIFKREKIQVGVIEVGLGGRFDATNVLTPDITAITSISFDHERHLGRTLSAIAFEKAGIAKRGVPLVLGRMGSEASDRIRQAALDVGAPVIDAHATTTDRQYPPLKLSLAGRHQLENAAVAVSILETWSALITDIPTAAIVTGLTDCEWPARLEWLRLASGGELLIDAAHNPAGAAALAAYLRDTSMAPLPMVFAVMEDKDLAGMIAVLAPVVSTFFATTVPHTRARSADELAAQISRIASKARVKAVESADQAVLMALTPEIGATKVAPYDQPRGVAAGSIYLIGPLRSRLISAGAKNV